MLFRLTKLLYFFDYFCPVQNISFMHQKERIYFLDWLRAIACLMVLFVHSAEAHYSNDYTFAFSSDTARWSVIVFQSLVRSCVPLFLMASAYLLVPIKTDALTFFKRRFKRVVIPLLFFVSLYAVLPTLWGAQTWSQAWTELWHACFTFPVSGSHLWFVYMLVGIYLIMPVLSPWLERISRREEQVFIGIWLFSTVFYRLRPLVGGSLFGECWWGVNAMFYYVSGFVGYVLLAHYIRTYLHWGKKKIMSICLPIFIVTVALCIFSGAYYSTRCTTPAELERDWQFLSFPIVLMSFSAFMLISTIKSSGRFYNRIIIKISDASYGMYLMHMFFLRPIFNLCSPIMPEYICIPVVAVCSYLVSFAVSSVIGKLPYGKYIVG